MIRALTQHHISCLLGPHCCVQLLPTLFCLPASPPASFTHCLLPASTIQGKVTVTPNAPCKPLKHRWEPPSAVPFLLGNVTSVATDGLKEANTRPLVSTNCLPKLTQRAGTISRPQCNNANVSAQCYACRATKPPLSIHCSTSTKHLARFCNHCWRACLRCRPPCYFCCCRTRWWCCWAVLSVANPRAVGLLRTHTL